MSFYHYFHDSSINDLKFNYKDNVLELFIDAYLKFIKIDNEEFICFATDNNEPYIYIVAKHLECDELY